MKPAQRQIERMDLSRIQERADFLKNPRFVPPTTNTLVKTMAVSTTSQASLDTNKAKAM